MSILRTTAFGPLDSAELARIREAADALLFAETPFGLQAQLALLDVEDLADELIADGRLPDATASLLIECVAGCGPRPAADVRLRTAQRLLNRPLQRAWGRA